MRSIFVLPTAVVSLVLTGCSTTPALVEMPEHRYVEYAELRDGIVQCGSLGKVEPAIAAQALDYLNRGLASYSYNPARLQEHVRNTQKSVPTDSQCRQVAMFVELRKQQYEADTTASSNASSVQSFNNMQPKQTYCNKIGTQLFCSTY